METFSKKKTNEEGRGGNFVQQPITKEITKGDTKDETNEVIQEDTKEVTTENTKKTSSLSAADLEEVVVDVHNEESTGNATLEKLNHGETGLGGKHVADVREEGGRSLSSSILRNQLRVTKVTKGVCRHTCLESGSCRWEDIDDNHLWELKSEAL